MALDFVQESPYEPTDDPLVFYNTHTEEFVVDCRDGSWLVTYGARRREWATALASLVRGERVFILLPTPPPDQPCRRTACRRPGATWWNTSTRAWYCRDCAASINKFNPGLCVEATNFGRAENTVTNR